MAPLDRPKRMLVRTSLVAGSTVATLIGAQTLIMIDKQNPAIDTSADASAEQIQITSAPELLVSTVVPTQITVRALPTAQIAHVAPSISIVRQAGQMANQQQIVAAQPTAVPTQVVIQPPATVQAPTAIPTAVPTVVQQQSNVQQPRPPRTHSSR